MDLATFPNFKCTLKTKQLFDNVSNLKGILNHIQKASKDAFLKKSENMILHNSQAGDIQVWDKKGNMVISVWIHAQILHLLTICLLLHSMLTVVNIFCVAMGTYQQIIHNSNFLRRPFTEL